MRIVNELPGVGQLLRDLAEESGELARAEVRLTRLEVGVVARGIARGAAMTALGAVFRPQLPPERLRAVAELADDSGLQELWLWEDCFLEGGVSTAAAALAWTQRLKVGIGLLPVPLRSVI